MIEKKYKSIVECKEGATAKIYKIESGATCRRRLVEIGFRKDESIKILRNSLSGPVAVEIRGTRIALGQGEARKIFIYEE